MYQSYNDSSASGAAQVKGQRGAKVVKINKDPLMWEKSLKIGEKHSLLLNKYTVR